MARDDALRIAGAGLLALLAGLALAPAASATAEDRDAICQGYRGTALWGQCTRAVDNGCHESEFAHPLCLRWEAQWEAQTGALPPWLLGCGIGSKCVFVTSERYTGDLGGLAGADAKCQALATAEGSLAAPGTYMAWLSTADASPATRFIRATTPYQLVNATQIAANWEDLTDSTLAAPININQNGALTSGSVWTNTLTNGAAAAPTDCNAWTPAESVSGTGSSNVETDRWTFSGALNCGRVAHLYCFQQ